MDWLSFLYYLKPCSLYTIAAGSNRLCYSFCPLFPLSPYSLNCKLHFDTMLSVEAFWWFELLLLIRILPFGGCRWCLLLLKTLLPLILLWLLFSMLRLLSFCWSLSCTYFALSRSSWLRSRSGSLDLFFAILFLICSRSWSASNF